MKFTFYIKFKSGDTPLCSFTKKDIAKHFFEEQLKQFNIKYPNSEPNFYLKEEQ